MSRIKGTLRVRITDNVDNVGCRQFSDSDDYQITFPEDSITEEQLKSHPYFRFYRVSPIMELSFGPSAFYFEHMVIEDGYYHEEVYSSAIPYLMSLVKGSMHCSVHNVHNIILEKMKATLARSIDV